MRKNIFRAFVIQMFAIALYAVVICLFWAQKGTGSGEDSFRLYNDSWTVETDGTTTEYVVLPGEVPAAAGTSAVLRKQLDQVVSSTDDLSFYTSHQTVEVYVGEELVYELKVPEGQNSKTPGNTWNFVKLHGVYSGQQLTVVLTQCYDQDTVEMPRFYYGPKSSVMVWYVRNHLFSFFLSILILLIGVIMVVAYLATRKTIGISEATMWLGLFGIPLGVWSALECQIISFTTSQSVLLSHMTFQSLELIPIPMLQFVGIIYDERDNKVLHGLSIAAMADFWITSALQFMGVFDYRQMLWVTHVIFVASVLYVLKLTAGVFLEKGERTSKSRQIVGVHAICVGIVAVCVLLDVLCYYLLGSMDAAKFSRIGFLIYIVVLAIYLMNDSIRLIRVGRQADEIRQEAEQDGMTKLKNRTAFERDIYSLEDQSLEGYGMALCDLNDLKHFNDTYGHSTGDSYIIICSEIIQDVLGGYGTVYRIGGDEFCTITRTLTEQEADQLQTQMDSRLNALGGLPYAGNMAIAMGFALYREGLDKNLSDTMKRADERMYQHKKQMKQIAAIGKN